MGGSLQGGRTISIHAPAKERQTGTDYGKPLPYFNPRSREGATESAKRFQHQK